MLYHFKCLWPCVQAANFVCPKQKMGYEYLFSWGLQRKKLQAPTPTHPTKTFSDPSLPTLPLASPNFDYPFIHQSQSLNIILHQNVLGMTSHHLHKVGIYQYLIFISLGTKVQTRMTVRTIKGCTSTQNRVAWTHGLMVQ